MVCEAGAVPNNLERAQRTWFQRLAAGDPLTITRDRGSAYAAEPAVLTAARATRVDGTFDGAFAAISRCPACSRR